MNRLRVLFLMLAALVTPALVPAVAYAQDEEEEPEPEPEPEPGGTSPLARLFAGGGDGSAAEFGGSLQVVRAPNSSGGTSKFGIEIFPEASRVWMNVRDTDPVPIERARRGGPWLCSQKTCNAQAGTIGPSGPGDRILRTIKVQTPSLPIPVTIWRRTKSGTQLDFDPLLLGRKSFAHVCAYPPVESDDPNAPRRDPAKIEICKEGKPEPSSADSADILLGMEWPREAELAGFRFLAIVDACGNARVQPFQRNFTVSVFEVASGGCGKADGKVLRVFPTGGFLRVTAFNLDAPASGDVMNVTYRVAMPTLESFSEDSPAKMLFPDLRPNDLRIDCGPAMRKGPVDAQGRPKAPGGMGGPPTGTLPVWMDPPPPPDLKPQAKPKREPTPGDEPSELPEDAGDGEARADLVERPTPPTGPAPPAGPAPPGSAPAKPGARPPGAGMPAPTAPPGGPIAGASNLNTAGEPGAKPLDHGSLVIAPEPLAQGNCRLVMNSQTKWRLVAPLALHVSIYRTDKSTQDGQPVSLLAEDRSTWIVTPSDAEFPLPALRGRFDGDSRLKLVVQSDPLNPNGKMVLVSDAGRVSSVIYKDDDNTTPELARRTVGSVNIHTVPLCGESNFETLEEAGSCIRAYLTIPAMLATIQVTRAPWVEKPLITRSVLSAVGVALAFDSYDPVERTAFPVAGQVGGFVQNLSEGKVGLMGYVGVAPTLPILGDGGNTTSFGFLAGIGMTYITNSDGPDEGFKPTAFLSVVVQVGQANPEMSGKSEASFGAYGQ